MGITNRVARYLGLTGITGFFSVFVLSGYFLSHRPSQCNAALRLLYAFNQHGTVVYLTQSEHLLMSVLPWASGILIAVAASIETRTRADSRKVR